MPKVLEIRELADFLERINEPAIKAANKAIIRATNKASGIAKQFTKQVFEGTKERPKSGALMNAIFAGFDEDQASGLLSGFVGVRSNKGNRGTKPYGRIHEEGGVIVPRKAKNLWIPLTGPKTKGVPGRFKNLTPREFIDQLRKNKAGSGGFRSARASKKNNKQTFTRGNFAMFPAASGEMIAWFIQTIGKGRSMRTKLVPLFLLRQRVVMPKRPYVKPAVEQVYKELPETIKKYFLEG